MQRICFTLSTLAVALLMSACAGPVGAQANQAVPTHTTEKIEPTVTPAVVSKTPPADCPLTVPQNPPFVPPPPYDKLGFEGEFWYGSNALWTAVRQNGTWEALPHNPSGYTQKVFWWREGYSVGEEPEPAITLTAERLDGKAPSVKGSKGTNASASDIGSAMLTGVDLPTLGCWKITGKYGDEELSFVVWVAP